MDRLLRLRSGKELGNQCCLILRVRKDSQREAYPEEACERGGVAQMGEHLPCKQGVRSSILLISTNLFERRGWGRQKRDADRLHGLIAQVVRAHA